MAGTVDTKIAPARGEVITKSDGEMAKAPALMLNPLAYPGWAIFLVVH